MTKVVYVWAWIDGEDSSGAPRLRRVMAVGEERPHDVPETAWLAEQDVDAWREEIMAELEVIDRKSVRALREGAVSRIAELENNAEQLRMILRALP